MAFKKFMGKETKAEEKAEGGKMPPKFMDKKSKGKSMPPKMKGGKC